MNLKDKVVIVTGGKRGIGKAISIQLTEQGANLAICAKNQEGLEKLQEELLSINKEIKVLCKAVNVCIPEEVNTFIKEVKQTFGHIDILINNAAIIIPGLLHEIDISDWDNLINTNLKGPFLCMKYVIPDMKERHSGHIINIGSIATKNGFPNFSLYCSSKFGLRGMTIAVREEVRADNIHVSLINPGFVDTEMWDQIPGEHYNQLMITPKEIANTVIYILKNSDKCTIEELEITTKQQLLIDQSI